MRRMPHLRRIFRLNGSVATFVIIENGPYSRVEHSRKHKGAYGLYGLSLLG